MKSKYRPVKQPHAPAGIDHRTATRYSTEEEKELAAWALNTLDTQRNVIELVPAPDPHFAGHKVRVQVEANPEWYIEFGNDYWKSEREFTLRRGRVIKALQRVIDGRVRGNGYEKLLLKHLQRWANEPANMRD